MATFTLKLDAYTLRKLTEAARKAGVSPERMAGMLLEAWVHDAVAPGPERAQPGVDEPAHAWADAVGDVDGPFDHDDFEWPEGGDPREDNAANYDLNEVGRPWSEVRPEMEAYLERKLAERK